MSWHKGPERLNNSDIHRLAQRLALCGPDELKLELRAFEQFIFQRAINGIADRYRKLRPIEEWHEDMGNCLWWRLPIDEPPYVGSPLDSDWPLTDPNDDGETDDYYTHFTHLLEPDSDA